MDSHDESRAFHPHAVSISGSLSQRLLRLAKTPHSARPTRLGKSNADPRNSSHPCPEPANVWESTQDLIFKANVFPSSSVEQFYFLPARKMFSLPPCRFRSSTSPRCANGKPPLGPPARPR